MRQPLPREEVIKAIKFGKPSRVPIENALAFYDETYNYGLVHRARVSTQEPPV